jgi:23S rRNA pseudouridine955/2504/2580 synthase
MKLINFKDLILFENDNYIVINKPPHIASLDERTADKKGQSIIRMAKEYWADAQLCHRLDKETSGCLAIAKHPEAYRMLAMQFEDRVVDKVYHAVTNGIHQFDGTSVYLPIKALKNGVAVIDRAEGKAAETIFYTLEAYKQHTLVACKPITGRMHQIRVHLQCLKAPIVHDELYGGKPVFLSQIKRKFNLKKDTDEQPLISRVALHAYALCFDDITAQEIVIEAPYPKDMMALIKQMRDNK